VSRRVLQPPRISGVADCESDTPAGGAPVRPLQRWHGISAFVTNHHHPFPSLSSLLPLRGAGRHPAARVILAVVRPPPIPNANDRPISSTFRVLRHHVKIHLKLW
jgi:hypothetical protein